MADGRGAGGPATSRHGLVFSPGRELAAPSIRDDKPETSPLDGVRWAKAAAGPGTRQDADFSFAGFKPGDIIYADPLIAKDGSLVEGQFRLRPVCRKSPARWW